MWDGGPVRISVRIHNTMQNVNKKYLAFSILAIAVVVFVAYLLPPQATNTTDKTAEIEAAKTIVLVAPPADSTAYDAAVARLAKESDTLTIGVNCTMEPLVIKLTEDTSITLENIDTIPHTVAFEDGGIFVLAPNYKKAINLSTAFAKTGGVHRYRCDDLSSTANVGVLSITK